MTDFVTGLRQAIQDLVSPDLKAIPARQEAFQEQMATMQKQMKVQHDATVPSGLRYLRSSLPSRQ